MRTPKKFLLALALTALACVSGGQARAASAYDALAYTFLADGHAYAIYSYQTHPANQNAYLSDLYGYYAQYYAEIAYDDNDRLSWYYAYLYGSYSSDYAIYTYYATGYYYAYISYYYSVNGANYAIAAYEAFQ